MSHDENILVIPEDDLLSIIGEKNVLMDMVAAQQLINHPNLTFRRRGDVEEDPSWKQLIPYVILRKGPRYLIYTRHKSGGESRLHDKRSMGIGGHISEEDAEGPNTLYLNGMYRELKEEVGLEPDQIGRLHEADGIIYDPSNDVGKVHVGILHIVDVFSDVSSQEEELVEMSFMPLYKVVSEEYERLEQWSKLFIDNFFPVKET